MLVSNLPNLLEEYQRKEKITQYELGRRVGMEQGYISKFISNDAKRIDLDVLARLCEVLEIDLGNIIIEERN